VTALLALVLLAAPSEGTVAVSEAADASAPAVSLQAGWWSVEGELRSSTGVFAAVGLPWMGMLLTPGGWTVPFSGRVGYQYDASASWKLRGSARVAGTYAEQTSCGCGQWETQTFGFLEVGVRYQAASGFIAGLDLPLFAFDQAHDLARGRTEGIELFPPPLSLAFSQVYVGYSWSF
jgi:hypothetical protein